MKTHLCAILLLTHLLTPALHAEHGAPAAAARVAGQRGVSTPLSALVESAFQDKEGSTVVDPSIITGLNLGQRTDHPVVVTKALLAQQLEQRQPELVANPALRRLNARVVASEFLNTHILETYWKALSDKDLLPDRAEGLVTALSTEGFVRQAFQTWLREKGVKEDRLRLELTDELDSLLESRPLHAQRMTIIAGSFARSVEKPPHADYTARWDMIAAHLASLPHR